MDELTSLWPAGLLYAFPPIPLLPKVVRRIRQQRALVILVAPWWLRRLWFSALHAMSVQDPLHLEPLEDLLHQGPVLHPEATPDGMAIERRLLLGQGLFAEVTLTILSLRRDSTVRIYNHTWKVFHRWCCKRMSDPLSADHRLVLKFLQDGLDRKLKPTTLRRQVEALNSVLSTQEGSSLARHPLVSKFLRGAALKSPSQRHRFPIWNLGVVLRTLMRPPFEPLREMDLKWARLKTIFLVAKTSARRISELSSQLLYLPQGQGGPQTGSVVSPKGGLSLPYGSKCLFAVLLSTTAPSSGARFALLGHASGAEGFSIPH